MEQTAVIPQPSTIRARARAAGIHFGISTAIFLILLYFIAFRWYPGPYFATDGGWQGVRIAALVDLVLGPLLTLIIFNPRKSRRQIRFDLSCIALAQACALVAGMYAVHGQRPVAVVLWNGTFYSVATEALKLQEVEVGQLAPFGPDRPPLVYAEPPTAPEAVGQLIVLSLTKGLAEYEQFHLYQPLAKHAQAAFREPLDMAVMGATDSPLKTGLERLLGEIGGKAEDYIYLPFTGRYGKAILVFSADGALKGHLAVADDVSLVRKKPATPAAS